MSKLTDIKRKIDELDGGAFQNLCDSYLCCKGYGNGYSLGMYTGTDKTAKGNPDTYFLTEENKYIFVMYTTQKENFIKKVKEDIDKCFDEQKTKIKRNDITEIVFCHTYGRLSPGDAKSLRDYCFKMGAELTLIGLDVLGNDIFLMYHQIAKDHLNISLETGQITTIESFVNTHDSNKMSAPINTKFMFREKELNDAKKKLDKNNVLIVYGAAGVGKTRFSIELGKEIGKQYNCETICIKSNGLEIYEDLSFTIEANKNYIVIVDDANELTGLSFVLSYLQSNSEKRIFKIIITVRDYARENIVQKVLDYEKPEKIKIDILKDEDIRKLIEVCYGIKNNIYSDRIVEIAQGNARLAMLAGRLLKTSKKIETIMDVTDLYEHYYSKQLDEILLGAKTTILTVGIIAFIQTLRLDKLEGLTNIFSSISLSTDDFIEDLKNLHHLEIVDLYDNTAAKISDQSFSNFLIKYIFIDKKLIPIDLMIRECFKYNKNRTIAACNILYNVFSETKVHEYLDEQINIIWDQLQENNNDFEPFFKVFHMIRPTETLLIIKEKIDSKEKNEYDVSKIKFIDNESIKIDDEIIDILCSFKNSNQLSEAVELLLEYYAKRPDLIKEIYYALTNKLGIDKNSNYLNYSSTVNVIDVLCHCKNYNDKNYMVLFVQVAIHYLGFVFSDVEGGRQNTITFYTIPINATPAVIKYRKQILTSLIEIYRNGNFKLEIERALKNYCYGNKDNIDYRIVKEESNEILSIISMFNSENIYHCSIAEHINNVFKKAKIDYDETIINPFINSLPNIIFHALIGNRDDFLSMSLEEERCKRRSTIKELVESFSLDDYEFLFQVAKDVEVFLEHDSYSFSEGLNYVFEIAYINGIPYINLIELYLSLDTPCNASPKNIIKNLFNITTPKIIKTTIEKYDFSQRNTWLWHFYTELPEKNIDEEYSDALLMFLSEPSLNLKTASFRDLLCIKKYELVYPDFFKKASQTILDCYEKSPFIFNLYFEPLFNPYNMSPHELIDIYCFDVSLLGNIYLKNVLYSDHVDYHGNFFKEFIKIKPEFLDEYLEQIVQPIKNQYIKYDSYIGRLRNLWAEDDYTIKINYIFNKVLVLLKDRPYEFGTCINSLFVLEKNIKETTIKQDKWIEQCIENHFDDCNMMYALFDVISEFPIDRRKSALLKFISHNSNYDDFNRLPLEPSSWGGSGSLIPYMENRISYLSSLIPHLSGIKYLKHRQKVENSIEIWKNRIKQEEQQELLKEWF